MCVLVKEWEVLGTFLLSDTECELGKLVGKDLALAKLRAFISIEDRVEHSKLVNCILKVVEAWDWFSLVHVLHHHECWSGHVLHILNFWVFNNLWAVGV